MDPIVATVIAVVALLVAVAAYAKASAAERRASDAEARIEELGGKGLVTRDALPPPAERAADRARHSTPVPESEREPDSEREPSPTPSPAEPDADPAVVARAEEMFRDAHAIGRQAGFDYHENVGSLVGTRVSVEEDSDLDRQAVAYLEAHEDRVLAVRRAKGKTYLIVDA